MAQAHQAVVVWGGWLLTAGVFFSVAGFFHPYYLSILAPPLAVLAGSAAGESWRLFLLGKRRVGWLLALIGGLTLALQGYTAWVYSGCSAWMALGPAFFVTGLVIWWRASARPVMLRIGYACLLAGMLVAPGVWSGFTNRYTNANQSLPAAYDGHFNGPTNAANLQVNAALLEYLQVHTRTTRYLMAVPSSMQGADYVLATDRPVLYIGGFNGQDQVLTVESLQALVETGQLRYIYGSENDGRGGPAGAGSRADISNWIQSHCTPVTGFDTTSMNAGAPDGTRPQGAAGAGNLPIVLFDCGE